MLSKSKLLALKVDFVLNTEGAIIIRIRIIIIILILILIIVATDWIK